LLAKKMPPKKAQTRKRAADLMGDSSLSGDNEEKFDATYVEEELADIKAEVDARCEAIASMAKEMQDKLQFALKTGLFRVPKKIKRTPINEFVNEHGALPDVAVTASTIGSDTENMDTGMPQTVVKGAQGGGSGTMQPPIPRTAAVAATPLQTRVQANEMATPSLTNVPSIPMATPKFDPRNVTASTPGLRTAQKGETVMSVNGSPIAIDSAVTMSLRKGGTETSSSLELNVLGDTMRLGSPSAVAQVESNPFMQQKLRDMQDEINLLLGQINVTTGSGPTMSS